MRNKRMEHFLGLTEGLSRPMTILDIGGTPAYWRSRGLAGNMDYRITTINLSEPDDPQPYPNITCASGDATNLTFDDRSFDIAYSNSVIEHLFTFDKQRAMAKETQRVAHAYYVQTPNYWFPVEPHFLMPGWQWLPLPVRARIIQNFRCGMRGPYADIETARTAVAEVRLMTASEMRELFPGCVLWREKILSLTKSLVAHAGFPEKS